MAKIVAICMSEKKGTAKVQVESAKFIEEFGIENDAHAGKWHRQISLLELKKIDEFNEQGGNVKFGDFGENLVIDGIEVDKLDIGKRIQIGDVILEITQIGKKCHNECEIFHRVGKCIMPIHGVFSRVIKGGTIKINDNAKLI
ncbi:MOSC domain-containing protein [Clostridium sp.]|uniref:MOSC domain-containing protein n=1 Tax=Clostridium sp. TaxID=1506 RepID=UPI002FCC2ABA